jgi:NitT/TauT family transport system substrate-binding protein
MSRARFAARARAPAGPGHGKRTSNGRAAPPRRTAIALRAASDDTLTVVLGTGLPPLMDALNLVAEGAGFFRAERLAVEKIRVPGAAGALEACASGKADVCPIGIERLFTGYELGLHARLVLSWASRYTYVLTVPADSPLRTLAGFKGAAIGVHEVGPTSTGQATVTSMLLGAGLRPGDFSFVPIGFNNLAALTSERVAAAGLPRYELIPYQVAGTNLRIFENPLLNETPSGGYAAAPATIAAKGDALARFARAIVKASLVVRFNPAGAARLMLGALGEPFAEPDVTHYARALALWNDALPARDPSNPQIGFVPPGGAAIYSNLLSDFGLTKAPVPVEAILDNRFNAFANAIDRDAVAAYARALSASS